MNQIALARARLKNFRIKPNRTEEKLLFFLHEHFPGKFIYNGGQIMFEGLIPDFFCLKQRVLLELVGRKDFPKHEPEYLEEREKLFNKYGFKVMYIYQEDLKDTEKLFTDILFFIHYDYK